MSPSYSTEDFGEPDLRVAGFQLWIHGRQYPDMFDFDDGNWLRVTAHCGSSGSSVWAEGSIIQAQDIRAFRDQCTAVREARSTTATLDSIEPNLRVTLTTTDRVGHISAKVEITPDHMTQSHQITFDIDQSYLPGIVDGCNRILSAYEVRGESRRQE